MSEGYTEKLNPLRQAYFKRNSPTLSKANRQAKIK